MPKRQRWTPVKGTSNRVYEPLERVLLRALDILLSGVLWIARRLPWTKVRPLAHGAPIRRVLILRLDRIGDVLMSLPALALLRETLPLAHVRLAIGRWSEGAATPAPIDELLIWNAPWVGRADEGAVSLRELVRMAWTLRKEEIDLAIDLQGDVRSNLLMYLTGAARRVGYANTGGAALLTDVVALDETVSWVEQNRRALATALPTESSVLPASPWRDLPSRAEVDQVQRGLGLAAHHPLVGIHPSGGRQIKQWDIARWREITRRLQERFGATVIVTGIGADRALADALALDLPRPIVDTTGRLSLLQAVALIRGLDLFLSPDTGTMHIACSVGTPSVTLFGPSDPVRYFSGAHDPARHTVIASTLWCAPCNLIRKPPRECREREMPECLASLSIDTVYSHIEERLRTLGFNPAPSP